MTRYKYKFGNRLGVRAPLYQTEGELNLEKGNTMNEVYDFESGESPESTMTFRDKLRTKFQDIFGSRQKWDDINTSMGDGKAMVSRFPIGNERKIKEKGPKGKVKTKYNPDGSIKKVVLKKGLRRIVSKPERDNRFSEMNRMRNIQDRQRMENNPELQQWIMENMPNLDNY